MESAGDGGVAQPRGANIRAAGSRRWSGEENAGVGGHGVNAGAAGLSFVLAQRAVAVVAGAGAEGGSVLVPLPVSTAALSPGLSRRKAVAIRRVILPGVQAGGPHCATASTASATEKKKKAQGCFTDKEEIVVRREAARTNKGREESESGKGSA